jgi:hypothetical protein
MPISGPSSYPVVCQLFFSHWGDVDAALGALNPLVLAGYLVKSTTPVTRAAFKGWYDDLMEVRATVEDVGVDLDLARGALTDLRTALAVRVLQFNKAVRGNVPDSRYARSLADVPNEFTNATDFLHAVRRVRKLWLAINADPSLGLTAPLTLEGGYPVASFEAAANGATTEFGLQGLQEKVSDAMSQLKLDRESRNDLQDRLYELLKAYRQVVATKFPEGHAILDAMPALTPAPGSTPDAVTIAVSWDTLAGKAKIEVQGAVPANAAELEVRGVPGLDYDRDDEVTLGTIPLGGSLVFLTNQFHAVAGQSGAYKVYVKTALGHEAGSNAGAVTRPV